MSWEVVENSILEATGEAFGVQHCRAMAGGCINEAAVLEDEHRSYFVKRNRPDLLDMFEAEAAGLRAILSSGCVRAPAPVATGSDRHHSWLVLEHIELCGACAAADLGRQLADLHRSTADAFGFHRDNYIGTTPQANAWAPDWVSFLREHRLGFQLRLAATNGAPSGLLEKGDELLSVLGAFFTAYTPIPALLHGDLWSGNQGADAAGQPVVFDPAVYYGDREADLAMTELFGGFGDRFYQSYRDSWDIDPGYTTRKVLYNLYHMLNHYNLFGGSYERQAQRMIDQLLAEV